MPDWLIAVLVGGAFGIVLGFFVARKSIARKAVGGGQLGKVLHYAATVALVAPTAMIITAALVLRIPFLESVGLCFGSIFLGFVLLITLAWVELRGKSAA